MRVTVEAGDRGAAHRLRHLLRYLLHDSTPAIESARVRVDPLDDPGGKQLIRCRARLKLGDGRLVSVEDIQPDLDTAVRRAVGRGLRASRRQLQPWPRAAP